MNQAKRKTCIGWMLAAIASCGTAGALLAMIVIEHPHMGWLIPALGEGVWIFLALCFGAWKLQMEAPEYAPVAPNGKQTVEEIPAAPHSGVPVGVATSNLGGRCPRE